jgi:hypothetical protein
VLRRRARATAIVVAAARDRCCGVQECWQAGGERECCGVKRERWRAVVLRRRAGAMVPAIGTVGVSGYFLLDMAFVGWSFHWAVPIGKESVRFVRESGCSAPSNIEMMWCVG